MMSTALSQTLVAPLAVGMPHFANDTLEVARLTVLRQTGTLVAALRQ